MALPAQVGRGLLVRDDPVDAIALPVKPVIAPLELHVEEDQQGRAYSQGKAEEIDKGEEAVPLEIAQGNGEKVEEHGNRFYGPSIALPKRCRVGNVLKMKGLDRLGWLAASDSDTVDV